MFPFAVKVLIASTWLTAMLVRGEAADTCSTTTTSCIPGLPGRDGKDGQPGRDGVSGRNGEPGPVGRDGISGPAGRDGVSGRNGEPGPAGRDGAPGRDGRDGLPGPPGSLTLTEQQQLKQNILEMLRGELSMFSHCNTSSASTYQSLQCTNPPTAHSIHTPQPTPQPRSQCMGTSADEPATSCKEVHECDPTAPSGKYWMKTTTSPVQVYCEMNTNNCRNITGGWMRVANIDMTNTSSTCPQGLTYTTSGSIRMCRGGRSGGGCNPVTFPTHSLPYTKVCGRARGYQHGTPDAFYNIQAYGQSTLNGYYADGLSVTSGSPRKHIWTFAAGITKDSSFDNGIKNCPCSAPYPGPAAPSFVGENYFCESGDTGSWQYGRWYLDDPLWDSQGCLSGSTCCDRGGPWFTTTLSQEVSDDIEVRWCFGEGGGTNEGVGVDQLEIFVY